MKLNQTVRHFAAKKALSTPVVGDLASQGLVRLHTGVFAGKADPDHAEERKPHLDELFDATMDTYLAALQEGFTEAEAREITHIQANFDFYNHGWVEMMEFPVDELDDHHDRFGEFFDRFGITIEDPLGAFAPAGGLPEAPATPEKLENPDQPNAVGGYADETYVDGPDGEVLVGGADDPDEVNLSDAPGVTPDDVDD